MLVSAFLSTWENYHCEQFIHFQYKKKVLCTSVSSLPPLRLHTFFSNAHLPQKRFGLIQTRGEQMIHPHPSKSLSLFFFSKKKNQNKTKTTHKYIALPACLDSYETSLRITEPNTATGSVPDRKASPPNSVPSHVKYMKEYILHLHRLYFFNCHFDYQLSSWSPSKRGEEQQWLAGPRAGLAGRWGRVTGRPRAHTGIQKPECSPSVWGLRFRSFVQLSVSTFYFFQ